MKMPKKLSHVAVFIFRHSGLEAIYVKINPRHKHEGDPPTFVLWILGIYVALYGIVQQKYEYSLAAANNDANLILSQALNNDNKATILSSISSLQMTELPIKPHIHDPVSVLSSFLGHTEKNGTTLEKTRKYLSLYKKHLNDTTMSWIDFSYTNLSNADFRGSEIRNCKFDQSTLYKADFSESNIYNCSFVSLFMRDANMSRSSLQSVSFISCDLNGTRFTSLTHNTEPDAKHTKQQYFTNPSVLNNMTTLTDTSATGKNFHLDNTYSGTPRIRHLWNIHYIPGIIAFMNCELDDTNFSDVNMKNIAIDNCTFKNSNITTQQISESESAFGITIDNTLARELLSTGQSRFKIYKQYGDATSQ